MLMTFTNQLGPVDTTSTPSCRWHTLPFAAVQITDGFWAKFQKLNREVSLQHGYRMLEQAGNFRNLRIAAGRESGTYTGRNFYDEDVYKWLEALAWELARQEDTELQRMADEVIELIAAAQRPDGYLDSYYQVVQPDQKWADLDHGHELYCAGHLIQAAVAFQRALSDSRLLAVAVKLVDHIIPLLDVILVGCASAPVAHTRAAGGFRRRARLPRLRGCDPGRDDHHGGRGDGQRPDRPRRRRHRAAPGAHRDVLRARRPRPAVRSQSSSAGVPSRRVRRCG